MLDDIAKVSARELVKMRDETDGGGCAEVEDNGSNGRGRHEPDARREMSRGEINARRQHFCHVVTAPCLSLNRSRRRPPHRRRRAQRPSLQRPTSPGRTACEHKHNTRIHAEPPRTCKLTGAAAFSGVGVYALMEAQKQGAFSKVKPKGAPLIGGPVTAALGVGTCMSPATTDAQSS